MTDYNRAVFFTAETDDGRKAYNQVKDQFEKVDIKEADIAIVLGGDGTMLEALHALHDKKSSIPVYGINCGSLGFLLNPNDDFNIKDRLAKAEATSIYPLIVRTDTCEDEECEAIAFNEISLLRETRQTAKMRIIVNDVERIDELVCDGVLIATPAGSTAYNFSANGPILPISANLLALTPISAFRPRRWKGALLPCDVVIRVEIKNPEKRPVSATADSKEMRDIKYVEIRQSNEFGRTLLFDPDHNLGERILKEQFVA